MTVQRAREPRITSHTTLRLPSTPLSTLNKIHSNVFYLCTNTVLHFLFRDNCSMAFLQLAPGEARGPLHNGGVEANVRDVTGCRGRDLFKRGDGVGAYSG